MKKTLLLLTVLSLPTLLTGCGDSDPDHARKVRCTELQHEGTQAGMGHGDRKVGEIRKDWDELQCKQSDIIQG
ncbi:hypothetical protein [Vibrio parahaemolyticus]|uniref:hypothetical protein n=1 Tax=Vibrio parahaemolyticus TaxID=670 RepID=UPI000D52FFB2|nr:hypothetical protein [Vibrio parahaemolyticus]AWG82276.1 hypothetical protein C9I78_26210 [Vibrio parahaemolyticus]AWJ81856.1 hypothetical protein C7Y67_26000 [Vibrio parahaemolyticus]